MKETFEGYKVAYEKKKQILYSRMDDSMIERLRTIRRKTGISVSEIIRESVRRLLKEVDETGSINLKILRPKVDLPHPDSPTKPSVSPLYTSKLTSSTAFKMVVVGLINPFLVMNCVVSFCTCSKGFTAYNF